MKNTIFAAASLLAATGVAQAADTVWGALTFESASSVSIAANPFNPVAPSLLGSMPTGTLIDIGRLKVTDNNGGRGYAVTYTYLGSESGYSDVLHNFYVSGSKLFEGAAYSIGSSVSGSTTSVGYLDFAFEGYNGLFAYNDPARGSWAPSTSIGLIGHNMTVGAQNYAFVLGYNDSFSGDADFDDFVVGINIAPIPEPETYAMLLAGLGLMGFVARRRKQRSA